MNMRYDEIEQLQERHPAWALLRAGHAALILGFLGRVFVERNVADLPASELVNDLGDELYALNQQMDEPRFRRSAQAYLDDWAAPERAWLRKFYQPGSDEPRYDISPVVEKTLLWVKELRGREFVGTESRLNTVFELLRQMVFGTEEDPELRLTELRRRRAEIDDEIAKVESGHVAILDSASLRDRYQQFSRTARELLSDFREVEDNFRRLDRELRKEIAGWTGSKGALLDEVLGSRNSIAESDQGRSFQAFYDFLLSHQRQEELTELLDRLRTITTGIPDRDDRLSRIHYDWIDASERTQSTVRLLSDQLRRFLDDQVWLENRRVFDLLRSIETKALRLRDHKDPSVSMEIDESKPSFILPTERPLYRRPNVTTLDSGSAEHGSDELDTAALVNHVYVDREALARRVFGTLGGRDQVGLREIVARAPLEQGLSELVGYLSLGESSLALVFDEEHTEPISWTHDDTERQAEMPRVTFSRQQGEAG
jgi:Protein of unknown function (DUF3375)